jgi:uncharacterized protein (TIGR02996 family)
MACKPKLPAAELQAFLDALAANPADETARLVFADWLP